MSRKLIQWFVWVLCSGMAAGFFAHSASAAVWTAGHRWDRDWENRYAQWIAAEVDTDLLEAAQIKVDCADLCYVVRAIFARNHSLPFLASDHSGSKLGHYSKAFDSLATDSDWRNDKRFKAFLNKLTSHVGTYSFPHDTYPVQLNSSTVQPGLIIYENILANHACFIGRVNPDSIIPVIFFEATVPPATRILRSTSLDIYIYDDQTSNTESGVVRWRWPIDQDGQWRLTPAEQMPDYSLQVFSPSFAYKKNLSKPLNQIAKARAWASGADSSRSAYELANIFYENIEFRIDLVQKADAKRRENPKSASTEEFDFLYGTQSRDKRLANLVSQIWNALYEYEIPRAEFFRALENVTVSLSPTLPKANLYLLFIAVDRNWISSYADKSAEERWGLSWNPARNEWILNRQYPFSEVKRWYLNAKDANAITIRSR